MIGIVGAGITGLALAHELAKRRVDCIILEGAPEPGGVIQTKEVEGHLLETGPQRIRLTGHVRALVAELGLEGEVIQAPPGLPLYIYRNGQLRPVPLSLRELFRTPALSWRGRARVLLEPLTRRAKEDETVAAFLSRKFGREAYLHLLGPLYGGLYGSDPDEMFVRHSLAERLREMGAPRSLLAAFARHGGNLRAGAPACTFRRGMRTLVDALYHLHAQRVILSAPVQSIRRASRGYLLETGNGSLQVDTVVLTVPADAAARLLREVAPDAATRLARLTYNHVAIVHLYSVARLEGFGYQVSFAERLRTRGVTWNASLFGREGVYTAFLGGARDASVADQPDVLLAAVAAAEFDLVTGHEARALHVARTRIPAWDRSWVALEQLELPPGVHLAANYESRIGIPGRLARARELAERFAAQA
jgi:oxygen-dependent protoporphyrinogen oxidase